MSHNGDLYEEDFYAWAQTTAALIRAGKWHDLDREALAEEIESLGKSQDRELGSAGRARDAPAEVVLSSSEHCGSWRSTIRRNGVSCAASSSRTQPSAWGREPIAEGYAEHASIRVTKPV
jgi:hypothetical protein